MQHLDLNQFMQDVHQNAIIHGWWEKERSDGTIRSLIHAELSEALEEYRANHPVVWHTCPYHPGACENQQVHDDNGLHCEVCTPSNRKPEGIAVELMDAVIRIFDYLAKLGDVIPDSMNTAQKLANWALDEYQDDQDRDVLKLDLPDLVDLVHDEVSLSSLLHDVSYLITASGLMMAWVYKQNIDPVMVILEKHEYNKTRSYKHGGKVC